MRGLYANAVPHYKRCPSIVVPEAFPSRCVDYALTSHRTWGEDHPRQCPRKEERRVWGNLVWVLGVWRGFPEQRSEKRRSQSICLEQRARRFLEGEEVRGRIPSLT